jgi:predicted dehydrogenase
MHVGAFVRSLAACFACCLGLVQPVVLRAAEPLRAGIIGCDTSHCIAFTELINSPDATGYRAQVEVVAAFPGGSNDIPSSRDRVAGYVEKLRGKGVEIVDSIELLLDNVDVVLLESLDGRVHLEQVRPVFAAGKRVFIDKPLAGSLADAVEIVRLGKESGVPWFSSSALRFGGPATKLAASESVGDVLGCEVFSPCTTEPHHPDLYWYGVHGVEGLYVLMGTGCESVSRVHASDADVVAARWRDGRLATFRGLGGGAQDSGATVFGTKGIASARGFDGYGQLVEEVCKFFVTGKTPVSPTVTLEMFAFMEAADESKRRGGEPVSIAETLEAAGAIQDAP